MTCILALQLLEHLIACMPQICTIVLIVRVKYKLMQCLNDYSELNLALGRLRVSWVSAESIAV